MPLRLFPTPFARLALVGLAAAAFAGAEPLPSGESLPPGELPTSAVWTGWAATERATGEPIHGRIRHPFDAWLLDTGRAALIDLRLTFTADGKSTDRPWDEDVPLPTALPTPDVAWQSAAAGSWAAALEALDAPGDQPLVASALSRRWADDELEAGRLEAAQRRLETALDRLEAALAVGGLETVTAQAHLGATLHQLSSVRLYLGASSEAIGSLERAASVWRRVAPETDSLRRTLNNLGVAYQDVGRLHEAQAALEEALALARTIAPDSLREAAILNNLGSLAYERGDLTASERFTRRALELRQRLAPDSLKLAQSLNNLAGLMEETGDLETAEIWYRQTLALRRRLGAESDEVVSTLVNLAILLARRDAASSEPSSSARDLSASAEEALAFAREALALAREASSQLSEPWAAKTLAHVLLETRGESPDGAEAARDAATRAVAGFRQAAPDSMAMADALGVLGRAQAQAGAFDAADASLREALAIRQRRAPGGQWEAASWRSLAELEQRRGRLDTAIDHQLRALETLEAQSAPPGETPRGLARAASASVEWYRDAALWSAALGRPDDAFTLAERSRARGLLATLAERRLRFRRDLPAALETERRALAQAFEALWQQLAATDAPADTARLRTELTALRDRRRVLERRIRDSSPRLAALRSPITLDAPAVADRLSAGTLLVTWIVGRDETLLLALGGPEASTKRASTNRGSTEHLVEAHRLPLRRDDLARRIDTWRSILETPSDALARAERGIARALWDDLLEPIAARLDQAERLTLIPDRALHRLPFAALVDPQGHHLIERLPIARAPSATVAVRLRDRKPPKTLLAFGDPLDGSLAKTTRDGGAPADKRQALAWSRFEVETLGAQFPGSSRVLVGEQATESTFKSLAPGADWIHFAGHTVIQDRFPLESFLQLVADEDPPGSARIESGRLHAWEVFEELRIDASLVTLSACQTSIGRAIDGEGHSGLAQAFLFAGADAVVSSLWNVRDRPTALLMLRLAHHLESGRPPDEALREAQLDLLQDRIEWPTAPHAAQGDPSLGATVQAALDALREISSGWLDFDGADGPRTDDLARRANERRPLAEPSAWAGFELLLGGTAAGDLADSGPGP